MKVIQKVGLFIGSYQISESMQTLNGMNGESVLDGNGGFHDDSEYHRLETNPPQNGFYDNNQTEFYPQTEQKYHRPPLMRMNSGECSQTFIQRTDTNVTENFGNCKLNVGV